MDVLSNKCLWFSYSSVMTTDVYRVLVMHGTVNEDRPIYVSEAAESTGWRWINQLEVPRDSTDYRLTLVWRGRYRSDARYDDRWRLPAKQWSPDGVRCTPTSNCVDDIFNNDKYALNNTCFLIQLIRPSRANLKHLCRNTTEYRRVDTCD